MADMLKNTAAPRLCDTHAGDPYRYILGIVRLLDVSHQSV